MTGISSKVTSEMLLIIIGVTSRGRDLGGLGETVPPKFEVGGPPMHWSPPIFWEVVLSDVHESTNRVKNCVFLVRKWSYTTFNIVNTWKMWEKKEKSEEPGRWLKKVIRNFYPENGNFSWNWAAKNFFSPPKFGARSPPMGLVVLVFKQINKAITFLYMQMIVTSLFQHSVSLPLS